MYRVQTRFALGLLVWVSLPSFAEAQYAGARVGAGANAAVFADLPVLPREVVEGYITMDGKAELRVAPTEIRIVLAITHEAQSAMECRAAISEVVEQLKEGWKENAAQVNSIVEDFIAVLPTYQWTMERRGTEEVGVESKSGYRMQSNLHLAVTDDAAANGVLEVAFQHGVTDIIAFDYWSHELDEAKVLARKQALEAARTKSEMLLSSLFAEKPPVINVQEKTSVFYPDSLYESVVNSYEEEVTGRWRSDQPYFRAYRPRNTYYRGLYTDSDSQPRELAMQPEISVVSTVRLYFRSGVAGTGNKEAATD